MNKKHFNLTVTDSNDKSITTTNMSTEHPEEIARLVALAGMEQQQDSGCGCGGSPEEGVVVVANEADPESEYIPTEPAELDLDDFSKKSPESIPKQRKKDIRPSKGDNPLGYSIDESEIFESLMAEFEQIDEEQLDEVLPAIAGAVARTAATAAAKSVAKKALSNDDDDLDESIASDELPTEGECDTCGRVDCICDDDSKIDEAAGTDYTQSLECTKCGHTEQYEGSEDAKEHKCSKCGGSLKVEESIEESEELSILMRNAGL